MKSKVERIHFHGFNYYIGISTKTIRISPFLFFQKEGPLLKTQSLLKGVRIIMSMKKMPIARSA